MSEWFLVYSWGYATVQIPECFHYPPRKPGAHWQSLPILPLPSPWKTLIYLLCLHICQFWTFRKNEIELYGDFWWLASFPEHDVLKIHPCCSLYQNFLPFHGCVITPLYGAITYLCSHQLKDIWFVSIFGCYEYCCFEHSHTSLISH